MIVSPVTGKPRRHHRPYEGQQLHGGAAQAIKYMRSSSPLRGATTPRHRPGRSSWACHHRPYEGQQPLLVAVDAAGILSSSPLRGATTRIPALTAPRCLRSSSPLRGATTRKPRAPATCARRVIIAPTRGNNMRCGSMRTETTPSHHRPYEGQQPGREQPHLSARAGHHRPYEGQQLYPQVRTGDAVRRHHRPYEGQQRHRRQPPLLRRDRSSSPLRGATTR